MGRRFREKSRRDRDNIREKRERGRDRGLSCHLRSKI